MSTEKGCLFRAKAARLECCRHQGRKPVLVLLNVSRYYTGQSISGRRCCRTKENLECHAKARFCYLCGTGWGRVLSWAELRVWTSYACVGLKTYAFRGSTEAVKHQKRRRFYTIYELGKIWSSVRLLEAEVTALTCLTEWYRNDQR